MSKTQTNEPAVLEARSYGMLDAIVRNILGDPEFQKAFFQAFPNVRQNVNENR